MIRKIQKRLMVGLAIAVAFSIAVLVVGRHTPAGAQSFTVNQGRYQFVDLRSDADAQVAHFAIFDTESGVLKEWTSKTDGEYWLYSFSEGRELLRRSITLR